MLKIKGSKSALFVGIGQATGYAISFVRNVAVARILGPEQFGIAATFIMVINFLDMLSDVNLDKLVVQSDRGDDPNFQATAQTIQLLRGATVSLLLFLLSWPVATFFRNSEALWAYQLIAVSPMLRAFWHLDMKRFHRSLRFAPDVLSEVIAQISALLVAICLAITLESYAAMAWCLLVQSFVWLVCTHISAERKFKLKFIREYLDEILNFGWPLLINGFLMFIVLQGDRAIIGRFYSMESLGVFAAALTLTLMPKMLAARAGTTILLPKFSRMKNDKEEFNRNYKKFFKIITGLAVIYGLFWVLVGGEFFVFFYGNEYVAAKYLVSVLGVSQAVAIIKVVPSVACLSKGSTKSLMGANLVRGGFVIISLIIGYYRFPLVAIAYVCLFGEMVSLILLSMMTKRVREEITL